MALVRPASRRPWVGSSTLGCGTDPEASSLCSPRPGLGDASALCWAQPPYAQLGGARGGAIWAELARSSGERLGAAGALPLPELAPEALWLSALLRLLLLLPLRLLLDRCSRSPTPPPAQFKFILSNDHLAEELQEILKLKRGGKSGAAAFKSSGGQGGWRMVGGALAPSRRFALGAVGEDTHYLTACGVPELQCAASKPVASLCAPAPA